MNAKTHTTRLFNAYDWSGEEITIDYNEQERSFDMYGYTFTVTHFNEVFKGEGYVQLLGDDWEDSLATIYCTEDDSLERLIIRAARWVRNHV